jgi:hypothetical protein
MEYLDAIDELLTKLDNNGQEEECYLLSKLHNIPFYSSNKIIYTFLEYFPNKKILKWQIRQNETINIVEIKLGKNLELINNNINYSSKESGLEEISRWFLNGELIFIVFFNHNTTHPEVVYKTNETSYIDITLDLREYISKNYQEKSYHYFCF